MKIDSRIERLVRDALHGAVKQDIDILDTALKAFPDQAARAEAARILVAVCAHVVVDLYRGERPTDDQLKALAARVGTSEAWSSLTEEEILSFLRFVMGDTAQQLDPDATVMMIFVVTGSLLSAAPRPEGQFWFNYLDRVEAAIEATP